MAVPYKIVENCESLNRVSMEDDQSLKPAPNDLSNTMKGCRCVTPSFFTYTVTRNADWNRYLSSQYEIQTPLYGLPTYNPNTDMAR